MELKAFEFLGKEVPSAVEDIREALDLLATSIDSAIEQVGEKVNTSFANKDFKRVAELSLNSEELDSIRKKIQEAILYIKKKYGKNALLKGMNLEEGATGKERNNQIGGHKA